jgi:hypothetical protein
MTIVFLLHLHVRHLDGSHLSLVNTFSSLDTFLSQQFNSIQTHLRVTYHHNYPTLQPLLSFPSKSPSKHCSTFATYLQWIISFLLSLSFKSILFNLIVSFGTKKQSQSNLALYRFSFKCRHDLFLRLIEL